MVCGSNMYGGVPRLFNQILVNFGLEFTYVDTSDVSAVEKAISELDRAAEKGVLHKNSVARRKSRLMKKLNNYTSSR